MKTTMRKPIHKPKPEPRPKPSKAELALKEALKKDIRAHGMKLADILGIYPC